jgi:hypothetical protein
MEWKLAIKSIVLALFSVYLASAQLASANPVATIVVPADTAYSVPHANALATTDSRGLTGWTSPVNRVRWYGTLNSTGILHCDVNILLPVQQFVGLSLKVGKITHSVIVSGSANGPVVANFGDYKITTPGVYQFNLSGLKKTGDSFGSPQSLSLSGPAAVGALFNIIAVQRGAPSVHLFYKLPQVGHINAMYNEVRVQKAPIDSYFMATGWNVGYFGIQVNSPTERRIIFSVWDNSNQKISREGVPQSDRVTLVAKGPGVFVGGFGNEGTGLHSHLVYHWHKNETYRFIVTEQPDGTHTIYSGWFWFPHRKIWSLIASFRAPYDTHNLTGLYSFIEDFWGTNGNIRRRAEFGPTWCRLDDGTWYPLNQAGFSDTGDKWRSDFSAGPIGDRFYMATGAFKPGNIHYGDPLAHKPPTGSAPPNVNLPPLPTSTTP